MIKAQHNLSALWVCTELLRFAAQHDLSTGRTRVGTVAYIYSDLPMILASKIL
jgi:hypothetical protein